MGEIAEDMVDGTCCQLCNVYFSGSHGYPVVCSDCWKDLDKSEKNMYQKADPDLEIE